MNRLCFVDLETTSLDSDRGEIWEAALILRDDTNRPDAEYHWQIHPDLTTADPMSLRLGDYYLRSEVTHLPVGTVGCLKAPHLTEDDDVEFRTTEYLATLLASTLDGAYLVCAVPDFDARFLRRFLARNGQCFTAQHRLICVENLVAGALHLPVPIGLAKSAAAMGLQVDKDVLHSALYDARLARDVYDAVMGGVA
jgi:DNA polymerase III epsilon subunit-like protein